MNVTERSLNAEERARLVRMLEPARDGIVSRLVVVGVFLIFIPSVAGGLLHLVLRAAGVRDRLAEGVGLGVGLMFGLWLWSQAHAHDVRQRKLWRSKQALVESTATVRTYGFDAVRAWEVTDHDYGPAQLIATSTGDFVFVHPISDAIERMGEPRASMSVTVAHPLGLVLDASAEGEPVPLDSRVLDDVGLADADTEMPIEFAHFTKDTLPDSWRGPVATPAPHMPS